jgi:serine/threonine protein kinase
MAGKSAEERRAERLSKRFPLTDVQGDQNAARFLREARAAARIQSEHVARVFDCGTIEGDVPYMVMELLAGHDLAQELKNRGPLPAPEAVDLILQLYSNRIQSYWSHADDHAGTLSTSRRSIPDAMAAFSLTHCSNAGRIASSSSFFTSPSTTRG